MILLSGSGDGLALMMQEGLPETPFAWSKMVREAQLAQSTHQEYLHAKHDLGRSPSEREEAQRADVDARKRLLAALDEVKIVRLV